MGLLGLLGLAAAGCGGSSPGSLPLVPSVARSPLDVPPPITRRAPERVHVHLVAREVVGELAHGERFLAGRQEVLRNEETVAVSPGSAAVFERTAGSPGCIRSSITRSGTPRSAPRG